MRILFMGTPEFARIHLQGLTEAGHTVCGAVTQQDRPKGRGMSVIMPPVKEYALEKNIPVYQPETLKDGAFRETLEKLNPELIVVVAYGRILPKDILTFPQYGCINVHGSLLPKYRGSAPVQWAVIRGEKETGVTTMFMNEGLDTGDILLQKKIEVKEKETSGELLERMAPIGRSLLLETIEQLQQGILKPIPQKEEEATFAPMLGKELGEIDWKKSAEELFHLIYGLTPWPNAYFTTEKGSVKVYDADWENKESGSEPGTVLENHKKLVIQTGKGLLRLNEVQLQGKRRMQIEEFLRGNPMKIGQKLN